MSWGRFKGNYKPKTKVMRYIILFLMTVIPFFCFSQVKTLECYTYVQYGTTLQKCTYEMNTSDVLTFNKNETYICKVQTATNEDGLKCQIQYKNGNIQIESNGTISPLIEKIPDTEGNMKALKYENESWKIYNSAVLQITAYVPLQIMVIRKI